MRSMGMQSVSIDSVIASTDRSPEELHEPDMKTAFDDLTGDELSAPMVRQARKEEMRYFKDMRVYDKVPIEECLAETGRKPIAVRWVDINKGDTAQPNYRSRLVAKELRGNDENPDWFAATPPSECLKLMLTKIASDKKHKLLYADVSRAYFYAPAVRPVYVQLPEEDKEEGDGNMCGRLRASMYGTRDAATN